MSRPANQHQPILFVIQRVIADVFKSFFSQILKGVFVEFIQGVFLKDFSVFDQVRGGGGVWGVYSGCQ